MSMEGIHKLKGCQDYDCIIFDECEDNLGVFASSTMKWRQVETFQVFSRLIRNCKKFVTASAFTTDKTLNFARSLQMPICLIRIQVCHRSEQPLKLTVICLIQNYMKV
jgi:hypothetical protein